MDFKINTQKKLEYAGSVLLDTMAKTKQPYSVVLEDADQDLEPLFIHLLAEELVEIDSKNQYSLTEGGQKKLEQMQQRYQEYLSHFDIFCAVDLETAEFAFESFFKMQDAEFKHHVHQERFADLRVAVAEHHQKDPVDMVFLSFFHEGRFGSQQHGWQFDLKTGLLWDELTNAVENAIHITDLSYAAEDGTEISADSVIKDVVAQGEALMQKLKLHAEDQNTDLDHTEETQKKPDLKNSIWN